MTNRITEDDLKDATRSELVSTIVAMDISLRMRDAILDEMPPCPEHGPRCVGFCAEWVCAARAIVSAAEEMAHNGATLHKSMLSSLADMQFVRDIPK